MTYSHKIEYIWEKYSSYIVLVTLILVVSLITYFRVSNQIGIGPASDTCDFLSNALVFAGQSGVYSDLIRPPFFSFLLSLIFRLGYISSIPIFVLDGLFYFFGVIGLYLLLKLRFNAIESFLGALLFATFPEILYVMGFGLSDIASTSLTILTIYFTILAIKKNSKFFYLSFPLAMLAFLTRYNSALIIFPIFLYIFINKDRINSIKNILTGIFVSFIPLIPVFIFFNKTFGNMFYPFMNFFGTSSSAIPIETVYYDPNLFFFIEKFPILIGFIGDLSILIIIVTFFIYGILKLKNNSENKSKLLSGTNILNKINKLKLALFVVLILTFLGSFGQIHYMFSEILFFILSYLFYDMTKLFKMKYIRINLLFFAWFMAFFIFNSVYVIKVERYFILMAPPTVYFLILCMSEISNRLPYKIKKCNITLPLITLLLTSLIILSTASTLLVIEHSSQQYKIMNERMTSASEWFKNYDPDYKNKVIYSDMWPYFGWYLKTNVLPMPEFKDNKKFYGGITSHNITIQDNMDYNLELESNNVDYYFCSRPYLNLTSYSPIQRYGNLIIYKRN